MEQQSKELASKLQSIIDTAIDGIITIDNKGLIESINPSAANMFLYNKEELIGQKINMLMPEPDQSAHDQYLKNYLQTKKPKIIGVGREVLGLKKSGEVFPFRLAVSEVILHNRIMFTGIIHDLTEVRKAQDELVSLTQELESKVEERTQELENVINELLRSNQTLKQRENELEISLNKEKELNELKTRFVSIASHEFRTPLSTILSSASIITKYQESEQQTNRLKHVNRIKSAVQNLNGILNDFLSLSKIEEGKIDISKEYFDVNELCTTIEDELRGILKTGQKILFDFVNINEEIYSDPRILKNVLFNLISNSIKYSNENDEIKIEVLNMGDQLKISIIDQGIGIPESEQKYLFERFFRATNVENIQGTGLGLSIVKKYITLLEGNLSFESVENVGTKFYIHIPKQDNK